MPGSRIKAVMAGGALLVLQGCATQAPTSLSFSPASDNGLAIVAGAPVDALQTIVFRQVDLDTSTFLKPTVTVSSGGIGHPNRIADTRTAGAALAAKAFPPGDYALVELTQPGTVGYATTMTTLCLGAPIAAPVFRVKAGEVAILRIDTFSKAMLGSSLFEPRSDADLKRTVTDALKAYPGVSGEVEIAEVVNISWPRKRGNAMETMLRSCAEPEQFTRANAPVGKPQ